MPRHSWQCARSTESRGHYPRNQWVERSVAGLLESPGAIGHWKGGLVGWGGADLPDQSCRWYCEAKYIWRALWSEEVYPLQSWGQRSPSNVLWSARTAAERRPSFHWQRSIKLQIVDQFHQIRGLVSQSQRGKSNGSRIKILGNRYELFRSIDEE